MTTLQASAQNQLRQLVEQIERLEEEKKALAADIRDKYLEAKAVGFDVKALRQVVRLRLLPHDGAWRAAHPARQSEAFHHAFIPRWVTPRSGTSHGA